MNARMEERMLDFLERITIALEEQVALSREHLENNKAHAAAMAERMKRKEPTPEELLEEKMRRERQMMSEEAICAMIPHYIKLAEAQLGVLAQKKEGEVKP